MTQDRYMSRGRVHTQVADLLDRAVADDTVGHKRRINVDPRINGS